MIRKLAVAVLIAVAFGAQAQTTVVAPEQPTLPALATVSPNAVTALGDATTNRVFIDQSGANPTVNMTQNGSGNAGGSSSANAVTVVVPKSDGTAGSWTLSNPIYLRGAGQIVTTVQTGDNNVIGLALVNPTTGTGVGAKVTIQQIGNNNTADVACGYGNASDGTTALTGCKAADLNFKFAGNTNHLQFRGTGDSISSAINVLGNSNSFFIDALTAKDTQTINVSGDNNLFNISQTSTGANGSSVWIDAGSTGTKYAISQSGTVDSVVNIKTAGTTGGSFNITQKN